MLDMAIHEGGIKGDFLLSGLRPWRDVMSPRARGRLKVNGLVKVRKWALNGDCGGRFVHIWFEMPVKYFGRFFSWI